MTEEVDPKRGIRRLITTARRTGRPGFRCKSDPLEDVKGGSGIRGGGGDRKNEDWIPNKASSIASRKVRKMISMDESKDQKERRQVALRYQSFNLF